MKRGSGKALARDSFCWGRLFRMTESDELKDSLDGGKKMREDLDKIRRWARRRKKKGNDWSSRGGGGGGSPH